MILVGAPTAGVGRKNALSKQQESKSDRTMRRVEARRVYRRVSMLVENLGVEEPIDTLPI